MTSASFSGAAETLQTAATETGLKIAGLLLSPSSQFSLQSLLIAFLLAVLFLRWRRRGRSRPLANKVLLRALFPRWMTHAASTRVDIGYFLFNVFLFGALFGWTTLSSEVVGQTLRVLLIDAFGERTAPGLSTSVMSALLTVALVLAYELGFWIDHWISHNVPFFWEAHKVHHTAEVLTPLTNFRLHPIDTVKFGNIIALFMGVTHGAFGYLAGAAVEPIMVAGTNLIVLVFMLFAAQLQHSQLWIPFTGIWGRVFISPAHHQIHHSTDPSHFGKNLGAFLAIWDWAFGTLRTPTISPESLVFGVTPRSPRQHTLRGSMLEPFWLAVGHLAGRRASATEDGGELDVRRPQELVDG